MLRATALLLLVFALGLPTAAAAAPTGGTIAVQLCGTLREHRSATAAAGGRLTIGTRTLDIETGAVAGNAGVDAAPGRNLCLAGSVARSGGALVRYLFFPLPVDGQICGTRISSSTLDGTTLRADFGALTLGLRPGVTAGQNLRVCFAVEVAADGDLVAVRSEVVDTKNEREWIHHCGTVKTYAAATAATSGFIAVGRSSWRIASGTSYTGDPAGDRRDRTVIDSYMCLTATLGDAGEIIEYATTVMPPRIGGAAAEYVPPVGSDDGTVTLSYRSNFRLKVPPRVADAADLARGSYCYATGVDAAGDAMATDLVPCQQGVATGPGPASPSPPTAAPSLAVLPPSPPSQPASGDERSTGLPLALLIVAGAAAVALAVALLAKRSRGLRS